MFFHVVESPITNPSFQWEKPMNLQFQSEAVDPCFTELPRLTRWGHPGRFWRAGDGSSVVMDRHEDGGNATMSYMRVIEY
jgi:hypothetical protein